MTNNEMITVPDEYKVDVSSPEFHLPPLVTKLGRGVVRHEIAIMATETESVIVDVVPGASRKEAAEPEEVVITPQGDLGKIPGTPEYAARQQAISELAYSELAAANAHKRGE